MPPRVPLTSSSASKDGIEVQQETESPKRATIVEQPQSTYEPYSASLSPHGVGSLYGASGMYGSGMYGGGMMGGYGSMYGGGMMYGSPMMTGPLSGLNQFLFSVQSVLFSLSQAVQIVGMNTHTLQQLLDSASTMLDHAAKTWHEMQEIEAQSRELESEEDKKRRRRLRALRWALVTAVTFGAYKLLRSVFRKKQRPMIQQHRGQPSSPYRPPASSYYGHNPAYGNQSYGGL